MLRSVLSKYRDPFTLGRRSFHDKETCRIVCSLSLIVKHWTFGYGSWAINAAYLLDSSEPLECLPADSLPARKMHIFELAYQKQFDEAQRELERACSRFGEDVILARMRIWLQELGDEYRKVKR